MFLIFIDTLHVTLFQILIFVFNDYFGYAYFNFSEMYSNYIISSIFNGFVSKLSKLVLKSSTSFNQNNRSNVLVSYGFNFNRYIRCYFSLENYFHLPTCPDTVDLGFSGIVFKMYDFP